MSEQQKQTIASEVSFVAPQDLGKLDVCMTDLMEQINTAIKVLVDENLELRIKLDKLPINKQTKRLNINSKFSLNTQINNLEE
jgi:uncharacterized FlaG/YvyC family protein